jgi:hypothetical protein
MKKTIDIIILVCTILNSSCDKLIDLNAKDLNLFIPEEALKKPEDMQALLNSCYDATANMMNGRFQIANDLLGDDIVPLLNNGNYLGIYNRNSNQFNGVIGDLYSQPYFSIYRINVMDLYYNQIAGLSADDITRMKGEGSFLRALCHFETVKLWAQPWGFTNDNSHLGIILRERAKNEAIARSSVSASFNLIINDLLFAIDNLPETNGVYADKMAAKALLAKVYFHIGRYNEALPLLNDVINSNKYTLSDSLNRYDRIKTKSEIVFGFVADSAFEMQRGDAFRSNYTTKGTAQMGISNDLFNLIHSDTTDRRNNLLKVVVKDGVQTILTTKFDLSTVFACPYITLTELLLTRAECLGMLNNNISQGVDDLNRIIKRAYGESTTRALNSSTDAITLLSETRLQRRIEMFCEGDRVQQFKRIAIASQNNPQEIRGAKWNCPGMILQFPGSEGTSANFIYNPTTVCN